MDRHGLRPRDDGIGGLAMTVPDTLRSRDQRHCEDGFVPRYDSSDAAISKKGICQK